jgi:TolB protein
VRRLGLSVAVALVLGAGPATAHSPPGRIAFVQVRAGKSSVWLMNAFGTGLRRLASGSSPAWSLTGTRIAFTNGGAVWVMAGDGSGRRRIARGSEPSWAPDGNRLVVTRAGALWVVSLDGRNARRLSEGRAAAWSPDGSTIAFERRGSIWTIPAAGGAARLLVRDGGEPSWSLDARRLAFTSMRAPAGGRDVYVCDADGSHVRRVTRTRADERSPTWSPDGVWIATAANRTGRYAIWLVSLSPSEVVRATVGPSAAGDPAWTV